MNKGAQKVHKKRNTLKTIYNVLRNIVVGLVVTIAALYMLLYVAVSLPPVQEWLGHTVATELEKFLGGKVEIGRVEISPFNRVTVNNVRLISPDGAHVADIKRLGAGISIGDLVRKNRIIITYAEIIGLNATLSQQSKDAPLNIQYIIDAVTPKDKTKPPTKFDLAIHSVVLRDCRVSYDLLSAPRIKQKDLFDPNHIQLEHLRADIDLPRIANDNFTANIKRMSFNLSCGLDVKMLKLKAHVTNKELSIKDFTIDLPGSHLPMPDTELTYDGYEDILPTLQRQPLHVDLSNWKVTPADFKCFLPALAKFTSPLSLNLDVTMTETMLTIAGMKFDWPGMRTHIYLDQIRLSGLKDFHSLHFDIGNIDVAISAEAIQSAMRLIPGANVAERYTGMLGDITAQISASGSLKDIRGKADIKTAVGNVLAEGAYSENGASKHVAGNVKVENLQAGRISGMADIGLCTLEASGDVRISGSDIRGEGKLSAPLITFRGYPYRNLSVEGAYDGSEIDIKAAMADPNIDFALEASTHNLKMPLSLEALPDISLSLDLNHLHPTAFNGLANGVEALNGITDAAVEAQVEITGGSLEHLNGDISIRDIYLARTGHDTIDIPYVTVAVHQNEQPGTDQILLDTPYLRFNATGDIYLPTLPNMISSLSSNVLYGEIAWEPDEDVAVANNFRYSIELSQDKPLTEILKLPIKFLDEVTIGGVIDSMEGRATLSVNAPWIQQGKKKLIQDTRLEAVVDNAEGTSTLNFATTVPAKHSNVRLVVDADTHDGSIDTKISWEFFKQHAYRGSISTITDVMRDPIEQTTSVTCNVLKSEFLVNDTIWHVNPAQIELAGKEISVNGLNIWREGQSVQIDGNLSRAPDSELKLSLADIDLSYVFDVLDINYVTFGGDATGEFFVSGVFEGLDNMKAFTPGLNIKDFSYNKGRLGDALVKSRWVGEEKMVHIDADIKDGPEYSTRVDGGIWVTRDSLSFDFDPKGVNLKFLQPFMAAFASDVGGRATGHAKLYGTFSDIDLVGKVYAHPVNIKVDYTNVWYSCTDTVEIKPGSIDINNVTVKDMEGHTALLNGYVHHRYFHEPEFEFNVRGAENMLCYDTNASMNPVWYGTVYGNGGGTIKGSPGVVDMTIDMSTAPKSRFTFALDKSADANDYRFISFTDKRKEEALARKAGTEKDSIPAAVRRFMKQTETKRDVKSLFKLDLRATITPDVQFTLIMDPVGGDKIRAYGSGGIQIGYNSDTEDLKMNGRYTLDKGIYNFTLQDLILKDFSIRPGSTISFNGDPYSANLNIVAAYKVNANLTDLDKSFSQDRDLTRTNVPVEALLLVTGNMQNPEISFDLDMPTVTQDVMRKVKSLISTEDMMSRQMVYLLALNRFYTPEYTGTQRNNNELASVASSTVSAQIGNMFGHLSDKWSFTPYFRTEKGDFSDLEVDLALSSSLLNNRLLLNGNLGYRDRATSTTTFIGDFDIEYLLNRRGTIRLKAYNHFNDANYYLRSALTTQGVGIMYKLEFDDLMDLFGRKKRKKAEIDSISQ